MINLNNKLKEINKLMNMRNLTKEVLVEKHNELYYEKLGTEKYDQIWKVIKNENEDLDEIEKELNKLIK